MKIEGEGEHVEYKDFEEIIIETIIAYGLEEITITKCVEISFSSDGADFTHMRGNTSTGFQILDIRSKYPGTDILIFDDGFDKKGNKNGNHIIQRTYEIFSACRRSKRPRRTTKKQ